MKIDFTLPELLDIAKIHPSRAWGAYLYGSHVYGLANADSDYDVLLVACTLNEHKEYYAEINGCQVNLHVVTKNRYEDDLYYHNMQNLECIYAPDWAVIKSYQHKFVYSQHQLIKNSLAQSFASWQKAKLKIIEGDMHRGLKSAFHSFRILVFAKQIIENQKIVDFSAANEYWKRIDAAEAYTWEDFRGMFKAEKIALENTIRSTKPKEV